MAAAGVSPDYDLSMEATYLGFFETPIVVARIQNAGALIADLEAAIRARMATHPGLERSNVGGWHSDAGMPEWGGPAARALVDQTIEVARRVTYLRDQRPEDVTWAVQMWANVSGPGALNALHVHPGNLWAAVFYVDLGVGDRKPEEVGGEIYFEDPRFPEAAMRTSAFQFMGPDGRPQSWHRELRPHPGDLILFPSWLRHGVRPYRGDRQRISVAMNLDAVLRQTGAR